MSRHPTTSSYRQNEQFSSDSRPVDPEWAEIFAEDALSVQERFPDEFERYRQLFYDFCRKSPYHIKRSYKGGFVAPRKKRRKDGVLYEPYCYEELLAKHLDRERWWLAHPDDLARDRHEHFWLGLRFGRMTRLGCIDFDNKRNVIGFYNTCMVESDPARPLPVLTVEHVQQIKRLYDTFPNRIWCVSSATLGLHIWEHLPYLFNHRQVEGRYRPKLRRIGLSDVEVYPSPRLSNQAFRRPFGDDYYTITDDGLLSDWVDQLEHFENPSTPRFVSIVSYLAELATREWRRYHRCNGLFITQSSVNSLNLDEKPHLGKFVYDDMALPRKFLLELARIASWIKAGCPEAEQDSSSCIAYTCINKNRPTEATSAVKSRASDSGNGDWVQRCVNWATEGLPGEDTLFDVVRDLARWFYFVEFFDVPDDHRFQLTTELLQQFALTKHNGFITTLNNGLVDEVDSRVRRIVQRAVVTATGQEVFQRIREKRKLGKYTAGNILLEPVIRGLASSPPRTACTCIIKDIDDTPLPASIQRRVMKIVKAEQMRRREGEYPFARFARRLLNALWKAGGHARISRATILTFLESKNPNQQLGYKKLLARHRLIRGDWENFIVQSRRCALYGLTKPVEKVFELHDREREKTQRT